MYLALYRKYRPKSFEDVLSQPHITTTLKNEVAANKTAHAYLFTGPRGTGKTTCSKILSMAVNCQNPIDGNPCMECESCKGIDDGTVLDVVEIDAASNNGVDSIRQLREEALYTPSQCRYRVYIIDEAHMLSTGAFNALLKIMEEPPEHVKFILATTEAHKVPATILSRCQRFDFRRIKPADIKTCLLNIADKEEFTLTDDAAELIARLADGGMRDALSILDRCIAFSTEVTRETVVQSAGVVDKSYLFDLTECIIDNDANRAVTLVDKLYSMSKDLQSLIEEMINHLRNIMLVKSLKEPSDIISVLKDEKEKLKAQAEKMPLANVIASIEVFREALDKLSKTSDKRLTVEICFIKLCTPSLSSDLNGILSRLELLENKIKSGVLQTASAPSPVNAEEKASVKEEPVVKPDEEEPVLEKPAETKSETKPALKGDIVPFEMWADVLNELSKTDPPICGLLMNSRAYVGGGFLYIDSPNRFTASFLKQENNAQKLLAAVEQKTGERYKIRIKSQKKKEEVKADALNDILNKAGSMGIKINEE